MRYHPLDAALFTRNRQRLCSLMKPNSIAILHSNDIYPTNADGTLPFHQHRDLFHLCGIDQEETILILFPDAKDPKQREILFTRETNQHLTIWEGEKLSKTRATQLSGISRVEWTSSFSSILHTLIPQAEHIYLPTNEHLRASTIVETQNARFIQECQTRYPLHRYQRLAPLMHTLRSIKQPEEISHIQHACNITEAGFRRILPFIKPGIGEWEIEAELLHEFIKRGSRGFAYTPIIGSGKNSCILHYIENHNLIQDGDIILLDVAAEYGGYASDMTRCLPANGRFSPRQKAVYNAVLRVMHSANTLLRPGTNPTDYQTNILEIMEKELIDLHLISLEDAKQQDPSKPLVRHYFMHGTSHHMGLDVHDVAPPHQPFAEGMVLTIEPGIYIREENLGIRLENNYLIGTKQNTDLMASIPIEIDEIEQLMNP